MADVDRISELPEPILHHILSFLSQKEAIQTSALSKTWRHVGPTRPKIELRESCFQKSSGESSFLSVLGNTLQSYNHQNLSVHEFVLEISDSSPDLHRESISVLDKEIPTLLTNMGQVKKFDFSVPRYTLDPPLVFKAEFLTELYLSKCNFMTSTSTNNDPLFKGLKRLSLCHVCVSEETFVQIMLSCRLIEYLLVSNCPGLKTIPEFILEMWLDHRAQSVLDKEIPTLLTNMGQVKKFDFSVPRYTLDPPLVFKSEFLTELYLSECNFMTSNNNNNNNNRNDHPDHGKPLFKNLKRLSLHHVRFSNKTLVQITHSCPLIEYLYVSCRAGVATIPVSIIFQSEFLTKLHLTGFKLTGSTQQLSIKRLKTLSLERVYIREETLDKIMSCSSPLIQRFLLSDCVKLPNIQLNNNNANNNKRSRYAITSTTQSVKPIRLNWYGHDKYFFPRLKTLCLSDIKLSAESFESLSSNFPKLQELELQRCYGFSEIQLTVSSIKRLVLLIDSTERMVITIYAPNIRSFELSVCALPELIFYTETAREWKSHVVMLFDKLSKDRVLPLSWLLQLSELLNSLRESEISLDVFSNPFRDLRVQNTNDVVFCNPVPLELVCVKGDIYRSCSFLDFLDCLFLICRPRYIGMNWCGYPTNSKIDDLKRGNKKLGEFVIFEIIRKQGEMSRGYLWERDLEEISMQVWEEKSKGWHNVRVEGTSFPRFTSSDTKIRFPLKWRGS